MKLLKDILYKVDLIHIKGDTNSIISNVCFDSRNIKNEALFIAIKGSVYDGHKFISQAIDNGAVAVVVDQFPKKINKGVTYIYVKDSSLALGLISSNFYDNPSEKIKLIGVTGTNGKTTVATLLYKLFMSLGHKSGLLSTVEYKVGSNSLESSHTTPSALQINALLSEMLKEGCRYCFMEVSSHAIDQGRIYGLEFDLALFTNISRDHLDYHKTYDKYISSKKKFFDCLAPHAIAIVNQDDIHGETMLHHTKANKKTYGIRSSADYTCKIVENQFTGLHICINGQDVYTKLIGIFNASNLLLSYAAALELNEDSLEVLTVLSSLNAVEGRFQQIKSKKGFTAIVDYAHTPDALKNVLKTIFEIKDSSHKLVCLIGCGGGRDKGKRPLMAQVACEWADYVVLTSDNPRYESPDEIIQEMKNGLSTYQMNKVLSLKDREEAIKLGITLCEEGDVFLVAGKGHEKYQEINGNHIPFDDMVLLKRYLNY